MTRTLFVASRNIAIALACIAAGFAMTMVAPRSLPIGAAFVIGGTLFGAMRAGRRDWGTVARNLLLALGTFGYPLFLGGRVLPWCAFTAHAALLALGWHVHAEKGTRIAIAQALAAAFAISLSAAATQFFFPVLWRWVAMAAVALFLMLIVATVPEGIVRRLPVPAVGAIVLALSEGLVVLHHLPTHWIINGAALALAFAAFLEQERLPRAAFASILLIVLMFGAFAPS